MLTQLRLPGDSPPVNGDAVESLEACHVRIRHFLDAALLLGGTVPTAPADLAASAASVERYFTVALPLHVEDEDLSLEALLLGRASPRLEAALHEVHRQHRAIEACLAVVAPTWRALAADPTARRELSPALREGAVALARLLDAHLALEEEVIFPAARRLPADELAQLGVEMRARRVAR
jgi:hypothetical protein